MNSFFLACDCHDLEHLIRFEYDPEEDIKYRSLEISTHLPTRSFLERLKIGFRYIFNLNPSIADMVVFDKDVANLEDFLHQYRNY